MLLSSVKVVELGEMVAAPFCGRILADAGADVIKVETPGAGDASRRMGPFRDDLPDAECSGLFLALNRNKRGVTLNVGCPSGREILSRLLADADVFIESNAPATMRELGLDYASLRQAFPRVIVASITAFGQFGPYRDYIGNELTAAHASGIPYFTPLFGTDPDSVPLKPAGRQAHMAAAIQAAVGVIGALCIRESTGEGDQVDVSEHEAFATWNIHLPYFSYEHRNIGRTNKPSNAPRGLFPCSNGQVYIVALEENQWQGLVEMMGRPDWTTEPWAKDRMGRWEHPELVNELIAAWTSQLTKEEVFELGVANRVPVSPVNTVGEAARSKFMKQRGGVVEIDHPGAGKLEYPGFPWRVSDHEAFPLRPAPLLGQHNEEVFCGQLGYSRDQLTKLRQAGVI